MPVSYQKFANDTGLHPTQKPVALLEYLIKTYTLESKTVLDFTMGSGSTGVACVNTGRKFIGIEQDDKYFEIASKRINETKPKEELW
jgi:site-specific DNA-methyltransferase (adenine-specific)